MLHTKTRLAYASALRKGLHENMWRHLLRVRGHSVFPIAMIEKFDKVKKNAILFGNVLNGNVPNGIAFV